MTKAELIAQNAALLSLVAELRAEVERLRSARNVQPLGRGLCPDETDPTTRDPGCAACREME